MTWATIFVLKVTERLPVPDLALRKLVVHDTLLASSHEAVQLVEILTCTPKTSSS
jgi:hypothetical protein